MEPFSLHARLPAPRSPLIGRAGELDTLRDLLLHADERLITLTGVGGCGKTRLALALATDLAPTFRGRVWLVELAPLTDPALVPITVAAALGLREEGQTLLDRVATFLASQPALLVLDSCEHLLDACADLADHLLATCPTLRILATSRAPLQIAGERQYRVAPLALPDPGDASTLDAIARSPAVQLFVARAQAVAPAFPLTAVSAPFIARICIRLDGIPLALELAAAWVRVLTLDQILDRLDDSIRLLIGGSRAAPTRQQTLHAALDWSDALLSDAERALFHRLAVFGGAFTLEAVETICADTTIPSMDLLALFARLVDKSLVDADTREAVAWYRLLEPVRQYALHGLQTRGEVAVTRARHAAFYLTLAERAAPALRGPEQDAWLARLEREQGNLRAALGWAGETRAWEVGMRLATALVPFWDAHGHLAEGRRWLQLALAAPTDVVTPGLRMRALAGAGRLAHFHAAYEEAERLHSESLALAREVADAQGIATALTELGMVARRQRDFRRSVALIEKGLAGFRELRDEAGIAWALFNLGATAGTAGDAAGAVPLLTESLTRFEALGDLRSIATLQAVRGAALADQGDLEPATQSLMASLTAHARLGDPWMVTFSLLALVRIQMHREHWDAAARLLGAAQVLGERVSSAHDATYDYAGLGAAIQAQLDAERFTAAWAEGHALTFDQAVAAALALAVTAPASPPRPAPSSLPEREPFTRREREVAHLLAQGESDRAIAQALFLSVSTVSWHVHRILRKLGLQSRHQVADWFHTHTPDADTPD